MLLHLNKILEKIMNDKVLLVKSIWTIFIVNIGNFISLIAQVYLSKQLISQDFTIFYSGIALVNLLASPILQQNLLLQKNFINLIQNETKLVYYINHLFKLFIALSFFYFLFFIFYFFYLNSTMKLSFLNNIMLFLILFFTILNLIPSCFLISKKKYHIPAIIFTVTDIIKLICLFYFIKEINQNNLTILFSIYFLFIFLIFIFNFIFMNKGLTNSVKKFKIYNSKSIKKTLRFLIYSLCMPLFLNTDIILASYLFNLNDVSIYIVASTISKITYFFFGVLFSIIFNEFSFQKKTKSGFIYFYLFIIIFFSIFLFLTSDYIVYFLYDKKYETATSTIKYLIPAFALISLINILSNILFSKENFKFIFLFFLHFLILLISTLNFASNVLIFSKIFLSVSISLFVFISLNYYTKTYDKS